MKFPPLATSFALPVQRLLMLALCCCGLTLFQVKVQAAPLPDQVCDQANPHYGNDAKKPDPCIDDGGEGSSKLESNNRAYYLCIAGVKGQYCCTDRVDIGLFTRWYSLKGCPNTEGLQRSAWGERREIVPTCKWTGTSDGKPCSGVG